MIVPRLSRRRCAACRQEAQVSSRFFRVKTRATSTGRRLTVGYCLPCDKEYHRAWREKNRDAIKERLRRRLESMSSDELAALKSRRNEAARNRYARNPEARREYARSWSKKNRERISARCKKWRASNIDEARRREKEWRDRNPEKLRRRLRDKARERRKTDPSYRLSQNLRRRLRSALSGRVKGGSAVGLLGCTIDEFKKMLEAQWQDGMSWNNYGQRPGSWNIDHIIPMSSRDLSERKNLEEVCHYSNLRPMWASDNYSKGATHAKE